MNKEERMKHLMLLGFIFICIVYGSLNFILATLEELIGKNEFQNKNDLLFKAFIIWIGAVILYLLQIK